MGPVFLIVTTAYIFLLKSNYRFRYSIKSVMMNHSLLFPVIFNCLQMKGKPHLFTVNSVNFYDIFRTHLARPKNENFGTLLSAS